MRSGLRLVLATLAAAALLTGCSVSVREQDNGVDVEVKPVNISIQTGSGTEPGSEETSVDLPAGAESMELVVHHVAGVLRIDGEGSNALSGVIGYWYEPPAVETRLSGSRFLVDIPEERNVVANIGGRAPRTELHLGARIPTRLEVRSGVGEVTVLVPADRNVRVELSAGIGSHNLKDEGFRREGNAWVSPNFRAADVLEVRLEAGVGQFRLERR